MHKLQVVVPFFIAGIGTCFAGILLDHVQFWDVFSNMDELFLLLPALLGLKGNLQMTLASRFSTHSHLGHLHNFEALLRLTCANLSLNQFLSIIISLCASLLVIFVHYTTMSVPLDTKRALLIVAVGLLTSTITSFLLDILMIFIVQISARFSINPDNVATPIAASLGDMTALISCSMLSKWFYETIDSSEYLWIVAVVILSYLLLIPVWIEITQENEHTSDILITSTHWYPLLTAMVISSLSGIILKTAISKSDDIALFQPVICGVGGNLAAVQASRLATFLHRNQRLGELPQDHSICMNPLDLLISQEADFSMTRLLMIIVIPGQVIFYFLCIYLNSNRSDVSWLFLVLYLIGSELQVILLLYLAHIVTFIVWKLRINPDNCTIPYLTSISDVLGACIITLICLATLPATPKSSRSLVVLGGAKE